MKVAIDFRELKRKKPGRVCVKGVFGMTCFMEKILTIMWCRRRLSTLWCLGCNWGEEGLRVKVSGKSKTIFKSIVAHSKQNIFSPIRFLFWFCFRLVWCSQSVVRFGKNLNVVLYILFWRWPQILVVFGMYGLDQGGLGKIECVFQF